MSDNVIDIKNKPKKEKEEVDFEEIMRKNADNKERLKKDREKANNSVKRSYRLRSKKDE